jgi:penicillin amidase
MRLLLRILLIVLAFCALAVTGGYLYLRLSLPKVQGEISVRDVAAPVEILRDGYGIPHIFAGSLEDAYFGLGFVHAQDRLWQMEMNRRIGSGRLAELLGKGALDTDRFLRTLGVRRAAEASLRQYEAESRRQLDAYAAGVNAFLATGPVLPPEFWILRTAPEPWTAVDSLVWVKMMAWDLGQNWRDELLRMRLAKTLPVARIQEFLPPYPGDAPVKLPDLKALYGALEVAPVQTSSAHGGGGASNSWVVAGARSASGKPLLANDPHLALTAPAVWYFAQLHAPGLDAIGATLPGVPGVLIGRNERIAWGFTASGADVQDLYLEKLDTKFEQREEIIKVRGSGDERITVRVSRHGPVISDVSQSALDAAPRGYALALAWTALAEDDLTLQAALRLAQSRDWTEFLSALRQMHAPQQAITYADVDGNIGFIAAGRVPLRKPANDLKGLAPAPGWDARYDWTGYIAFDELPRAFNPASGAIIAANHKIVPPGYSHHITTEWQAPYRARRIEELLGASAAHSVPSFARLQMDVVSLAARDLLPFMNSTTKRLENWNGEMGADRPEPLLFTAWSRELARAIYADELGDAFRGNWGQRALFLSNALATQSHWCDDVLTQRVEACEEALSSSLERAVADLHARYGADWKWGEAHVARQRHRPFSREPWLAKLFDIRVPTAGDSYTVNAGRVDFNDDAEPYANRHAASLRAIYDLADPQASLYIHSGGQSGNRFSPHYRSLAAAWARGDYVPMVSERRRLEAAGVQRLVLEPK